MKSWWKVQSWRSSGGGEPHAWLGPMWYILVATINLENYCPEIILIYIANQFIIGGIDFVHVNIFIFNKCFIYFLYSSNIWLMNLK
jgi:hypothetical protein